MNNTTDNNAHGVPLHPIRRLRVVLIIPMAILEIAALCIGWVLAVTHKPTARRWADFYMRILPDGKWYYAQNDQAQAPATKNL